jgi:hypothetical protein
MRFYDFDQKQLEQFTHTVLFAMLVMAIAVSALTYVFRESLASAAMFPAGWLVSIVVAAFLFEVFYTALALHQFALNLRRCFGRLQKAVVFRTETCSQSRCLPSPDEQPHDDCDQRRNDYDCEPHLRLLIHGCHLVHFGSQSMWSKRGAVSLCFLR